jgi:hypothetical protein
VRFRDGDDGEAPARVSGKHKRHGPALLPPDAVLAHLSVDGGGGGGATFAVRTGVRAALLEVNERLLSAPATLRNSPAGAGFVAILKPQEQALAQLQTRALGREAYTAALAARAEAAAVAG